MCYRIDSFPHIKRIKLRMKCPMLRLICCRRGRCETSSLGVSFFILFALVDAHMVALNQLFAFSKNLIFYAALHERGRVSSLWNNGICSEVMSAPEGFRMLTPAY